MDLTEKQLAMVPEIPQCRIQKHFVVQTPRYLVYKLQARHASNEMKIF
jgi:hypothetical protein